MKQLPEMLCRWNAFEHMLRDALQAYADKKVSAERTLEAIDTYQAATTRRGNVLGGTDTEGERTCWELYERHLEHKRFAPRELNEKFARLR